LSAGISAATRFAFQPLVNLHTGGVMAMEMLARPTHHDVRSLLRSAARTGELERLDAALAAAAAQCSSEHETLLPLHLNLMADTVATEGEVLTPLHRVLSSTARQASQTVLEINPSDTTLRTERLLAGLDRLRRLGYRIALDGVGTGNYPLTVIAQVKPDLIKMDREIVAGLPDDSSCVIVLQALQHLAFRIGAQVVAEGVERPDQLATLREYGVGIAQGYLLGPPNRRPTTHLQISVIAKFQASASPAPTRDLPGTRITDFMHPAVTLPLSATGEEVRAVLRDRPAISGVVLVDEDGRPRCTLDRNRFLLAVSGVYGHALYAAREAARLGDEPRILMANSSASAALELVRSSAAYRRYDDIVVLDSSGQCTGAVCVGDVIQGVAQLNLEQAAALHPLTRLPGSSVVAQLVDRKIADQAAFAVSWLDVDELRLVNARSGFAAGDDLIRELGRALTDAAEAVPSGVIAHIGGDDFVAICDPDDVLPLGSAVLDEPWEVDGHKVTLSLASLTCLPGTVTGYREVSRMLARLRRSAKSMSTTSWVSGRPGSDQVEVIRSKVADMTRADNPSSPSPADWPRCGADQALLERRTG
jgi:EAL domain-containing protein (putative c-di-GMP-specific phosphodiesterase class I)/GGDEF domain-containing protein